MKRLRRRNKPLCQCGCGGRVKKNWNNKSWNKFIDGHQNKGKNNPMYGRTHTKKYCRELSKRMLGNKNPAKRPEVRKLLSKNHARAMYGKKHTEEAKRNISKNHRDISGKNNPMYKKGYKISGNKNPAKRPEVKEKISKTLMGRFIGNKNPSWKGGISFEPYCHIWTDKEYKESIRERDNYKCQNPGCWDNCNHLTLELHHINYIKKNCHPWNLITICKSCNTRANENRNYWTKFYQNIMTKKYGYKYEETKKKKIKRRTLSNIMCRSSFEGRYSTMQN